MQSRWNSRHSRSRIGYISDHVTHRHPAAASRTRGLPAIGFQLDLPPGVTLDQCDPSGPDRAVVLRAHEERDGRRTGDLEVGIFSASLIIDRSGVLEELVTAAAAQVLGERDRILGAGEALFAAGASGHRIDAVLAIGEPRPALPYLSWLALASEDLAVPGGLFVTIRSAGPSWDAASRMLDSLRISGLGGRVAAPPRIALPLVRGR